MVNLHCIHVFVLVLYKSMNKLVKKSLSIILNNMDYLLVISISVDNTGPKI